MAIVIGAVVVLAAPLIVWRERWLHAWQWWQSALFFLGWFCVGIPAVAVSAGAATGDTYAKVAAQNVISHVALARSTPFVRVSAVIVSPSEHATGATLDVPYQGETFDYAVNFAGVTRFGDVLYCQAMVSLYREKAPRRVAAEVSARIRGTCSARS
ncbi:hypothetical protein EF294_18365 [Gordonia oryzae]|uniref:Uncharacterized protein n=2 Tax=Gordonia oryzae TaxID=2487349 RepID=A0A3N4GEL9_9ACTN|nr:hypothetical protein EF294_18365 [Gordonia oryzae]